MRIIEWLDAETIARQMQPPLSAVPQREGEHTNTAPQRRLQAPLFDRGQDHFGIGMAAEAMPQRFQFAAQLGKVIDLAVVGDDEPTACRNHRLVAFLRQVDDRQPLVAERHPRRRIDPRAGGIRPAVPHRAHHPPRQRFQRLRPTPLPQVKKTGKTTHRRALPLNDQTACRLSQCPKGYSSQLIALHTQTAASMIRSGQYNLCVRAASHDG